MRGGPCGPLDTGMVAKPVTVHSRSPHSPGHTPRTASEHTPSHPSASPDDARDDGRDRGAFRPHPNQQLFSSSSGRARGGWGDAKAATWRKRRGAAGVLPVLLHAVQGLSGCCQGVGRALGRGWSGAADPLSSLVGGMVMPPRVRAAHTTSKSSEHKRACAMLKHDCCEVRSQESDG